MFVLVKIFFLFLLWECYVNAINNMNIFKKVAGILNNNNHPNDKVEREINLRKHLAYEKEMRPVFNEYMKSLDYIKHNWTYVYKSKDYNSKLANHIEKECWNAIKKYEDLQAIDKKHNKECLKGSKAFTQLAILYERRNDFESAINVCNKAISFGMDESKRITRLSNKLNNSGRRSL